MGFDLKCSSKNQNVFINRSEGFRVGFHSIQFEFWLHGEMLHFWFKIQINKYKWFLFSVYQSNARVSCMHLQPKRKFRMNAIQLHFCYEHKQLTNNDAQHNMCMCRTCNRLPQGLMRSFWYQLSEFRAFFPSLCDCSTICLNDTKKFLPEKKLSQ